MKERDYVVDYGTSKGLGGFILAMIAGLLYSVIWIIGKGFQVSTWVLWQGCSWLKKVMDDRL